MKRQKTTNCDAAAESSSHVSIAELGMVIKGKADPKPKEGKM